MGFTTLDCRVSSNICLHVSAHTANTKGALANRRAEF